MDLLNCLQNYWWLLIAVLGAALVFLLFVQGGQSMLLGRMTDEQRTLTVNSLGRKWELTFTTLVVFGGAFFASFPLFYSTSFGGAYWLWMLILFSFILQAVSYEFRSKPGNLFGTRAYDTFLFINGCVGCVLLGVAVAMFFFGAEFTVTKTNLLDAQAPVISSWVPTHGFEAIFNWKNLVLGVAVLFLARTNAALYFIFNVRDDEELTRRNRRRVLVNGLIFAVFFVLFAVLLLTAPGQQSTGLNTTEPVDYKYLNNYLQMWWALAMFLIGTVAVLYAIYAGALTRQCSAVWFSAVGTVLVVLSLFFVAGYNDTAYYPSLLDPASSLTIRNSSSSLFTLKVMSWVSIITPFVIAYIAYVWNRMDLGGITPTEMSKDSHKY